MPLYLFSNPSNDEDIIEIIMSIHDSHEYIKDGIKWNRVFTKPTAAIDTKWDPNSKTDFTSKTGSKKGTLGDILDKSAELSQIREKREGKDIIKQSYYDSYAAARDGKRHLNERKEKLKEVIKDVTIKWSKKNS